MPDQPVKDPAAAFRRLETAMRKLVNVPKKAVDDKIATERRAKHRRKPA